MSAGPTGAQPSESPGKRLRAAACARNGLFLVRTNAGADTANALMQLEYPRSGWRAESGRYHSDTLAPVACATLNVIQMSETPTFYVGGDDKQLMLLKGRLNP
jgi:hypothetical protein